VSCWSGVAGALPTACWALWPGLWYRLCLCSMSRMPPDPTRMPTHTHEHTHARTHTHNPTQIRHAAHTHQNPYPHNVAYLRVIRMWPLLSSVILTYHSVLAYNQRLGCLEYGYGNISHCTAQFRLVQPPPSRSHTHTHTTRGNKAHFTAAHCTCSPEHTACGHRSCVVQTNVHLHAFGHPMRLGFRPSGFARRCQ